MSVVLEGGLWPAEWSGGSAQAGEKELAQEGSLGWDPGSVSGSINSNP